MRLQRYKDGGLSDVTTFKGSDGLNWVGDGGRVFQSVAEGTGRLARQPRATPAGSARPRSVKAGLSRSAMIAANVSLPPRQPVAMQAIWPKMPRDGALAKALHWIGGARHPGASSARMVDDALVVRPERLAN